MIRATPEPDDSRSGALNADEPSAAGSADAAGRDDETPDTAPNRDAMTAGDRGDDDRTPDATSGPEPARDDERAASPPALTRPPVAPSSALSGDARARAGWGYHEDAVPPVEAFADAYRSAEHDDPAAVSAAASGSMASAAGTATGAPAGTSGPERRAPDAGSDRPPGLRAQIGATRGAVGRLVSAHVELARAELADIVDEVKKVAILAGVAIGALVVVGFLIPIGLSLFIGETLFGSMGWGVLHGSLFLTAVSVAALLVALGVGGGTVGRDFVIAAVLGILVGVVLGLDLTNRAWAAAGDAIATGISPDIRPLVVGAASLAVIGGILGLIAGGRAGGMGGALGLAIFGVILGGLVGVLTAVALGPRVGAALGVTVGLATWPILMGIGVGRRGIDTDALKARFWPDETIETTKETIEWVRARTPLGPKS